MGIVFIYFYLFEPVFNAMDLQHIQFNSAYFISPNITHFPQLALQSVHI